MWVPGRRDGKLLLLEPQRLRLVVMLPWVQMAWGRPRRMERGVGARQRCRKTLAAARKDDFIIGADILRPQGDLDQIGGP